MTTDRDPDLERFRDAMHKLHEASKRGAKAAREMREAFARLAEQEK